jgi:hypothetical protein
VEKLAMADEIMVQWVLEQYKNGKISLAEGRDFRYFSMAVYGLA